MLSYKNDYLKNKVTRGSLEIKSKDEVAKLTAAAAERVETLKMFFFKYKRFISEHLTDKDIKHLSAAIGAMLQIDNIHADFGK